MKKLLLILVIAAVSCDTSSKKNEDKKDTPVVKVDTLEVPKEDDLLPDLDVPLIAMRGRKPKQIPQPTPTPTPIPNTPSGTDAVLYFDFDGEVIQGYWNGGQRIDAVSAPFSQEDIDWMMNRVQTAYSAYRIIVTSDRAVYDAATTKKQMIVVTPTSSWYPNTGYSGVAAIGSIGSGTVAWVWSDRLASQAQYVGSIMIHEAGHALGLRHQGEYTISCSLVQTYKMGANMGNNLYVLQGEWIYQQCSGQNDNSYLAQTYGTK